MVIEKTEVKDEDLADHRPLIGVERAEAKRYDKAKAEREVIAGVRTEIDKEK